MPESRCALRKGPRHEADLCLAPSRPGRAPRVAMQIVRHSQILMTMEVYSEVPSAETAKRSRSQDRNRPLNRWVELRGLEPLTPSMRTLGGKVAHRRWGQVTCPVAACRGRLWPVTLLYLCAVRPTRRVGTPHELPTLRRMSGST